MTEDTPIDGYLFEVSTLLGFRVKITRAYWKYITEIKHPVMAGRQSEVQEALENPSEIRLSRSDPLVYLFYSAPRKGRWVCSVVKRLNGDGFLITCYPTDTIKEGTRIWPK